MTTKTVYSYDAVGLYLGTVVAQANPLEPASWLMPASTTDVVPPVAGAHQVPQWASGAWALIPDYRGWSGYKADGAPIEITVVREIPDSTWSATPPAPTLAQAQAAQGAAIKTACAAAIAAGFTSPALGSAYSYGSQAADQTNIATAAVAGGTLWCANGSATWSFVAHTAAQAQQVRSDLWAHIQACQTKYTSLLAQISAATTVAAVQAISW